tara:strand:+ start:189 stop:491 length:303 start_codon:yes stop_codon:yes gene_type:complete
MQFSKIDIDDSPSKSVSSSSHTLNAALPANKIQHDSNGSPCVTIRSPSALISIFEKEATSLILLPPTTFLKNAIDPNNFCTFKVAASKTGGCTQLSSDLL